MNSPFLRNRQNRLAQAAGNAASASTVRALDEKTEAGREYASLKVKLEDQLRQLSDMESLEGRAPLKVEFLKDYSAWVDGVIAADAPVQDDIVMTCLVWSIDVGNFEDAVRIGEFALKHGLAMPDRYKRSAACFLREDIAEIALKEPDAVDLQLLAKIDELTQGADMPDPAKAKLHKALGRAWTAKADAFDASDENAPAGGESAFVTEALSQMKRALSLNDKVGVKKDVEKLEARLRKLQSASGASDND